LAQSKKEGEADLIPPHGFALASSELPFSFVTLAEGPGSGILFTAFENDRRTANGEND
jgi:hypothetical protein